VVVKKTAIQKGVTILLRLISSDFI